MRVIDQSIAEKELGRTQCITCSNCGTKQSYLISRRRRWLTLLGIPLLIRSTDYSYRCPHCGNGYPLVRQQAAYMLKRAIPNTQSKKWDNETE